MKLRYENIDAWMGRRQMSQADIARKMGCSEATAHRLLKGKKQGGINFMDVHKLAKALGVSESEIVELDDVAQTDDERAMLAAYREIQRKKLEQGSA